MSPNMKLSLLAFVGAATAVPHYGGHRSFHKSGYAGPTGGWAHSNGTQPVAQPTGSGAVVPVSESTTTIDGTQTSTETIYSTLYLTHSKPSAAASAPSSVDVAGASGTGAGACGPATVTVTATNKVTVTVPAGGAASSAYSASAVSEQASSSSAASKSTQYVYVSPSPVESQPAGTGGAATPSTSATVPVATPEEQPTYATGGGAASSSAVVAPSSVAAPSSVVVAPSSVAAPASSTAQSSAAAPSSTGTTSYSGGKRGLAYRYDGASAAKSFAGGKYGFAWNWESDSRGDIGDLNFIPTLRTLANAGDWAEKVEAAISAGSKVVFGLNEPDIDTQANLGVSAACDAWIEHMNPIKEKHPDVIIAAPAVSSSEDEGKGLSWLRSFTSTCTQAKFDVINLHWYGPASAGAAAFQKHIDGAIEEFGKNAWVTEFGLYAGESAANAKSFLTDALTYLDGQSKCDGYSYYAVGDFDPSSNLLGTADALTDTGKVYAA